MQRKRRQALGGSDDRPGPVKRARLTASYHYDSKSKPQGMAMFAADDFLSSLSDELLVRILSFLSTSTLVGMSPVSRRFYRLSADSQLWRTLYYHRFVLPRALKIPGFRDGSARGSSRIQFSTRRTVWADGGWGRRDASGDSVDWKRQYKLRHNWASGNASVQELKVGESLLDSTGARKTLVKVIEGIAVTADCVSGMRAWDLKTKESIAQINLTNGNGGSFPTCIAIDAQAFESKRLDVSVGFMDGSFGVWGLYIEEGRFLKRYRHEKSSNGQLVQIVYHHPFILTATESVLVSLYDFERTPSSRETATFSRQRDTITPEQSEMEAASECATLPESESDMEEFPLPRSDKRKKSLRGVSPLPAPVLLTSLKSHTSRAPLALSIRLVASHVIASIAYTFSTLEGWSIGIQDLQIRRQSASQPSSEIVSTRLAFTKPVKAASPVAPNSSTECRRSPPPRQAPEGPTTLCYSHPYLLAAMPDNTMILHICTSNATKVNVSSGIRLWGHTSGISDAEITARGKAVSVSSRGEEIRVWELEGRVSGKSIEIRPKLTSGSVSTEVVVPLPEATTDRWDDRRNWVGFDDEMVIVLKEAKDGNESLMVYDFS
ncbi:F-box domain-containing protein [Colletotrichum orchidophilum]|uniref:F-box domain-containing protein n=1 Tax=Colletotrichum orchidophilum TaxID=1209926 RepID=A0A1G4ANG8_9PEZI|nr:F-box domain-containing protein [Colletotrichum orchidophilum]OHE90635.1 F-box domain-containing protein [Colletotrichum orchidophilum]